MNAVEVADRLRAFIAQLGQPLACLDIETTGSQTERDRITEIGIVTLHPDGSQSNWSCLIHPGCAI
ncbi:MAG: hypothetical protein B7X29_07265, partial [Halothiobacillus sp. 13-55-115]